MNTLSNITNTTNAVVTYTLGKIAYANPKRRSNLAQVNIGFRKLKGNDESYFSVTGDIWNAPQTDFVAAGAGLPKTLRKAYFPTDTLLARIVSLADKHHLTFSLAFQKKRDTTSFPR